MAHYIEQEVYTSSEESGAEDSDEDIITDYLSPLDDNGNLDAGASAATSSSSPGATVAAINVAAISTRFYSTESPPSLRISAAEDMEPAGAAATDGGGTDDRMISNYATAAAAAAAESIPIISVTQHSPAASKAFFILEDNLRQLHGIQESIQRMRQVSVQTLRLQSQVGRRLRYGGVGAGCNWSLSCPSLSGSGGGGQGGVATGLAGHGNGNNNEADWLGATLADWDSPTPPGMAAHYWVGGDGGPSHKAGLANGSKRRRSWASPWEVDEMGLASAGGTCGITYEEAGGGGALDGVGGRTRSISLSSGDTDNEQDAAGGGGGHSSRARQAGITTSSSALSSGELKVLAGRHSTHSLNDMGFPLIPALPTKPRGMSKDGGGGGRDGDPSKWLSPRILTLQKSISTPSILAVKDGSNLTALTLSSIKNSTGGSNSASNAASATMAATIIGASVGPGASAAGMMAKETQGILMTATAAGPTSSFPRISSYTGLESETDDDSELHLNHHHHLSHDHVSSRYSLGSFVAEPGFENDDDANSSKRRKRGSIFFRKRKDKDKEKDKSKLKQPHQFVPVCHSNSQPCDVCSKSLTNKAALRCESCAITVHENSCRDQVSDCTRFKVPKSIPLGSKVSSLANLTGSGHAKLQSSHSAVGAAAFTASNPSSAGSSLYYSVSSSSAATSAGLSATNNHVTAGSSANSSGGSTWSVAQSIGSTLPSSSNSSSTAATNVPASSSQTPSTPIASPLFGNSKCGAGADKDPNDPSNTPSEDQPSHATNEGDGHDTIEGVFNAADIKDLDLDPELGILDEEAEAWVGTVDKKISKKLKEKEIKRQEHIYEFIITEKHHCLTLKVMQKIFAEGMRREMRLSSETVDRIFPCLEELIEYHLQFLRRLRQRQRQESIVSTIEDILRVQFSGLLGDQLRSLYGEFCSRHQEAVSMYKEMIKEDRKFAAFARQCTLNPLCKKKGIPECILFVTQRITKYPLLIDPLIKTSREQPEECLKLQQVLGFVKDILIGVNAQVAEKERKLRLIEVYNKIDAKSATTYKNKKFKKSDLLSSNRRLMFEGVAYLNHARGKVQLVTVVVLSDVVFFLQESNQKFHFVTQDNKAGVISLQKLLVREKAGGQDTRSIYLISSNPDEPEMYELQCQNPREKRIWIDTIRAAVEQCPEDEEGNVSEGEEQRKIREAQDIKTRQLIATLREKDRQLGSLLEEKMATFCELVELLANNEDSTSSWLLLGSDSAPPKYSHLVEQGFQSAQAKETLSQAMTELCRLLGLLLSSNAAANWNLSRSVSSVGERHSDTFSMPLLPKRAETFGGFDQNGKEKGCVKKKSATDLTAVESTTTTTTTNEQPASWSAQTPPVLQLNGDQQAMGLELVHNVSTLLCLLSSQATAFESLRNDFLAEIKASRSGTALTSAPFGSSSATLAKFQHKASHNQRLEELRNLQDRLSKEKAEWSRERTMQEEHISEQRKQLLKLQEQVRIENTDIQQQRENLYQKLEALRGQGILLSPNMTIVSTAPMASAVSPTSGGEDADATGGPSSPPPPNPPPNSTSLLPSPTPSSVDLGRRKTRGSNTAGMGSASAGLLKRESCSNLPLPMNLISAKNEQKAVVAAQSNTLPIKQQLPMKLAKLGAALGSAGHATGGNSNSGGSNNSSHGSPHGNVASPTGGGLVQQLLPLRLSESLEHKRASPKVPSTDPFKPKLSSSSFSPPASKSEDFVAGHSRTGSSPASIQMLSPRHHHYHHTTTTTAATTTSTASAGGNMHPPKVPDKPASLLLQQAARGSPQLPPPPGHHQHHQAQPPPKVHDPETNQEIVFL